MRYILTVVWAFLISLVLTYVLSSMAGDAFAIAPVFVLTIIFSITIYVIGDGILDDKSQAN